MKHNNILVTMSGGTTQVINATLQGILQSADAKVFTVNNGLADIKSGPCLPLIDISGENANYIGSTPGSFFGTSRIERLDQVGFKHLETTFARYGINRFINIGGSGTIKQSKAVYEHFNGDIKTIALPKTVDNDLGDQKFEELLFTPGFPSIVQYWNHKIWMLNNENRAAYTHDKVLVAQTFGRDTGHIAGAVRFADPDRKLPLVILLPEDQMDIEDVIAKVEDTVAKHGRCIVIIAEGYHVKDFNYLKDKSGQIMWGSSGSCAAQELVNELNRYHIQSRIYNPTIDQRQDDRFTPYFDRYISKEIGSAAIKYAEDRDDFFVTYTSDNMIKPIPLSNIDNYSRYLKPEWIDYGNFDVTDKYVDYIKGIFTWMGCGFPPRDFCRLQNTEGFMN